jgi:hypothetical protein
MEPVYMPAEVAHLATAQALIVDALESDRIAWDDSERAQLSLAIGFLESVVAAVIADD